MKKQSLFIVTASCLVAACSTTPIDYPKLSGPNIIFARDSGLVGSGCTYIAIIDGEEVAKLRPSQTASKAVTPGKHRVAIDNDSAMCPNVRMNKVVEVANEPVVLRIAVTSNFQVIFDQVE
jgi:hypothetical protein